MDEKQEFEMGLPNGVGEQMLAHTIEKFDVKLEHTEFGPKLIGCLLYTSDAADD